MQSNVRGMGASIQSEKDAPRHASNFLVRHQCGTRGYRNYIKKDAAENEIEIFRDLCHRILH
jgi:hypothetical protein